MTKHKDAALFDGIPDDLINDFAAVRKAKKAPITATAINGIKREAAKAGMTLEQAITICCENNWAGFKAQWVLNLAEDKGRGGNSPWWASDVSILAKGAGLHLFPLAGERMDTFKGRIQSAIDNGGAVPVQNVSRVIDSPPNTVRGKRPDVPALASLVRRVPP